MAFCTNCGQRFADGQRFCAECGANITGETTIPRSTPQVQPEFSGISQSAALGFEADEATAPSPSNKVGCERLPREILGVLTQAQRDGLAFGVRKYKVLAARIQSFQTGAKSRGHVAFGGLSHALGAHWGAFGGVGAINSSSVNLFRTDIQFKLLDQGTNKGVFIARSLPFAMTLSVDPNDVLEIYFVIGGLQKPCSQGDFAVVGWTPFAAKSMNTGQVVPFSPLPTLAAPLWGAGAAFGLILGLLGLLVTTMNLSGDNTGFVLFGLIMLTGGASPTFLYFLSRKKYKERMRAAIQFHNAVSI